MNGVFTPYVPGANDIALGEGVVHYNYGAGGGVIGATRNGSKFVIEKKIINIKYDGAYGPTKGLNRVEIFIPKLVINFLKLSYSNLAHGVPSTVTDKGDYHEFAYDLDFTSADVLTNIAFIGQKLDGKVVKIVVLNALNTGNINLNFKEKDEVVGEMEYTGFYAAATPTSPPFYVDDYDV
jgi:hypothetical protein